MTVTSGSPLESFAAPLPMAVRIEESGVKIAIKKHSEFAVAKDNRSLYFFAMLLGSISPMKNTTIVVARVPIATALPLLP